jgi:hypothetical protein
MIAALALVTVSGSPAGAFSSGSSITTGGVTYKASAYSCNLYWSSCSWNSSVSLSSSRSFTHRADVKANGINVSLTISADSSAGISGNSTSLATATEYGYGRSGYMAGVAKPSVFSVSVAARTRLSSGSAYVNSGWTTW